MSAPDPGASDSAHQEQDEQDQQQESADAADVDVLQQERDEKHDDDETDDADSHGVSFVTEAAGWTRKRPGASSVRVCRTDGAGTRGTFLLR